jgi:hypothetical protein
LRPADRGRTSPPPLDGEASEGEPATARRRSLAGEGGTGFRSDFGVLLFAGALGRWGAATAFAAGSAGWRPPFVSTSTPQ